MDSAEEFYFLVGINGVDYRKLSSGSKPLVISSIFKPKEILLTYDGAYSFFKNAVEIMKQKGQRHVEELSNLLEDMRGWDEQKEMVVYAGTERIIKIEKDLTNIDP